MGELITYEPLKKEPHYEAIVKQHALLVKRIAYHLMVHLPYSIQVDDLMQAGMIGLLEAAKHYDPKKGASFATYAGIRIRGYMLDELRSNQWVPRSVYRHSRLIKMAEKNVENRLGRDAKDNEIAKELNLDLDEYHVLQQDAANSHLYGFDDLGVMQEVITEEEGNFNEPQERVLHEDMAQHLVKLIETLPTKERMVLALYYEHDLNLKEIGKVLAVSESRVSQIHSQAMMHLQAKMKAL